MNKHLNVTVKGRVQGVGFRAFVKRKAAETGIKGTVKNLKDGTVFIEAEGEELQLDKFIEMCSSGPPLSSVETVDTSEGSMIHYTSFAIVY